MIGTGLKVTFSILPVDAKVSFFFTVSDLTVVFLVGFDLVGFVVGFIVIVVGFIVVGLECEVIFGVVTLGLEVVRGD